jgi:pyruvate/2-oxoglutarate dehydrogenase complex dihydrolipoamide dehydrogenase (E3) component/CheY-like chemotaxis protein
MNKYDVVIIGGGPAGVTCAISARNTYPDKRIALIRKEETALIPCGIPYVIHSLSSVDDDILPDKLISNAGADLIIGEVVGKEGKTLTLANGRKITFDKLVLALGSNPVIPPIKGVEKGGVFVVKKDRNYLSELKDLIRSSNNIVIIGGGYIGIEMADELMKAGKKVTIVEMLDRLMPSTMDREFGEKAEEILEAGGIRILVNNRVDAIVGEKAVAAVRLQNGEEISADMVIVSAGARPNVSLASKFGLAVHPRNGIWVNEYLRTFEKDIYAIGDCAAKYDFFTGEFSNVMLASTAMAEGRLVGANLFGIKMMRKFIGVLGSFSTKIGNTAFGTSGLTEEKAKEMNLDYTVGEADAVDRHPGKLPGASKLHLKLIFARYSHTLLGAQMYGGDSVGELVNMFSVMILNKMTDMDIDNIQIGTHPLLSASPIVYPVINATVDAIKKWYEYKPVELSGDERKKTSPLNEKQPLADLRFSKKSQPIKHKSTRRKEMEKAKKILVIDDDPEFINGVQALLRASNYEVVSASDPKDGKKKVLEEKPDLILLDIMMDSIFDGFSLCHEIKTSAEYKKIKSPPIIFVSAVKEKAGSRFEFDSGGQGMVGPDDYLDKPVKPDVLLSCLQKHLTA